MSKTVWKYSVDVDDQNHQHLLPSGSRIVEVGADPESAAVVLFWAEFHTYNQDKIRPRQFRVFGTGHVVPTGYEYVGTCQARYGLVWHLYEVKPL